ncbi:Transcriptional regulator GlxA family, contains an amidase domain and an AraC-type DNA-binding HTH domain [Methylobacterium sp. UNC300MFChir4.1]|uniref:GlxA family transcriptional regulator n=1 Tax=Methylobacterium sp. UNC300MFChir4.1 TaxID=1502747 RepID=UPI0008CE2277|nr:helix-turn-helix domain-containing protein [Methylobacterium sp. UNC300MFChir4.1]SEO28823.1 Transcriptional regulator GlxA family, contains an amidase domain and an AraC-type DNA-binding HTH domain [Methylobacterium sp. UNC300MFChir4.1]
MPKSPRFSPDPPRPVEVLAFPSVQLLDVAGPLQVFATANEHGGAGMPYAPRVIAAGDPGLTASAGLRLVADPLPDPEAPVDTLVIAGGPGVVAACDDAALVAWVRARAGRARRVASVCTGAFLLGAAGLLDGRRAVTHWKHCGALAARYRRARIEPDPIFVRDGPVWSSAGVTAGIDLALALVEEDLGRATALTVARHLVMFLKRPGGQAQFSAALALQAGEERFGRLHAYIADNLSGDLSLPALAAAAGMSARSLSRHYHAATGLTPARAVERLRVEAARRALAETAQPVKRVARTCGFGSEETMRRSFLRHVAATPQEYRARFGG